LTLYFASKKLICINFMGLVKVISEVFFAWVQSCLQRAGCGFASRIKAPLRSFSLLKLSLKIFILSLVLNGFSPARAGAYEDYWAAIRQDAPANVLRLILGGFDPNTLDTEGNSGLTLALSESSFKVAEVLLALDEVEVNVINKAGWNALALAAVRGHEGAMRRLIGRKVEIPKAGLTPLHHAARGGHVSVMRLLLEQGISADALGPRGNTPLMLAAGFGNAKAVQLLLEAGAQPRLKNQLGYDALELAQLNGNTEAVPVLAAVTPRTEAVARLPARRPSAATLTPPLPAGPVASRARAPAPLPPAEPVVQATGQSVPAPAAEPARPFAVEAAVRATPEPPRQAAGPSPAPSAGLGASLAGTVQSWMGAPMRAIRQALTPVPDVAQPSAAVAAPAVSSSTRTAEPTNMARPSAPQTAGTAPVAVQRAAAPSVAATQPPKRIVFVPPSLEPRGPATDSAAPRTGW
jgi:ankyrin repeat protein